MPVDLVPSAVALRSVGEHDRRDRRPGGRRAALRVAAGGGLRPRRRAVRGRARAAWSRCASPPRARGERRGGRARGARRRASASSADEDAARRDHARPLRRPLRRRRSRCCRSTRATSSTSGRSGSASCAPRPRSARSPPRCSSRAGRCGRAAGPTLIASSIALRRAARSSGASSNWLPLTLAALAVAGFVDMISVNIRSTTVALVTPNELRGRVGAVEMVFISRVERARRVRVGRGRRALRHGHDASSPAGSRRSGSRSRRPGSSPSLARMGRLEDLRPEPALRSRDERRPLDASGRTSDGEPGEFSTRGTRTRPASRPRRRSARSRADSALLFASGIGRDDRAAARAARARADGRARRGLLLRHRRDHATSSAAGALRYVEFDQTGPPPDGVDLVWLEAPSNPFLTMPTSRPPPRTRRRSSSTRPRRRRSTCGRSSTAPTSSLHSGDEVPRRPPRRARRRGRLPRREPTRRLWRFRQRTGPVCAADVACALLARAEDTARPRRAPDRDGARARRAARARIRRVETVRYPGFGGLISFDVAATPRRSSARPA